MGLKDIIAYALEYGFVYPSSDIYGGLQAVYDYGPNGTALKNNIKNLWWASMTQINTNIVGIDSAVLMHPTIWRASGHLDNFNDLMIDNKDSKKRYRVDTLLETHIENLKLANHTEEATQLALEVSAALNKQDLEALYQIIKKEKIKCPISKTSNWTNVRHFNLMFATQMGSLTEEDNTVYLRPETAQGIFVNFLNIQKTTNLKVPFGIAQIGKAFRNEIVARQFIFRMREFEQMEMQFFIEPGQQKQWFNYWQESRLKWYKAIGIEEKSLNIYTHEQLAHYADNAIDIQYQFPFGLKEVEGIHSRTNFDLTQHQKYSNKKLEYFDQNLNKKYLPYVIETSIGCDRALLMIICNSLIEEEKEGKTRKYLKLHPYLAPIKAAILPLVKNPELTNIAQNIFNDLKTKIQLHYSDTQSIGKRYAKQDIIGTPYCITVDHKTLEDESVTIRFRDTTEQERVNISKLLDYIEPKIGLQDILRELPEMPKFITQGS
jgi:glycyl-tRNA synthetase